MTSWVWKAVATLVVLSVGALDAATVFVCVETRTADFFLIFAMIAETCFVPALIYAAARQKSFSDLCMLNMFGVGAGMSCILVILGCFSLAVHPGANPNIMKVTGGHIAWCVFITCGVIPYLGFCRFSAEVSPRGF